MSSVDSLTASDAAQIMTARLRLRNGLAFRSESYGGIIYDRVPLQYIPINKMGYQILRLAGDSSIGSILSSLASRYPRQSHATLRRDLVAFMTSLASRGLLQPPVPAACTPAAHPPGGERFPYPIMPSIVDSPYDTALRSLKAPLIAQLAVIFTCNLLCKHCYTSSTRERPPDTLTFEEICRVIRDAAEQEVFDLSLTGGEALLRPDVFDIISYAKRYPLFVNLNTNGTPVTPRVAVRLRDAGLDQIRVSIDSADAKVHDEFRGRQGALSATIRGIRRLVYAGLRTEVHATLSGESGQSHGDIDAIIELCRDLGVARVHFGTINAVGRADAQDAHLKLEADTLESLVGYVEQLAAADLFVGVAPHARHAVFPGLPDYDGCGNCLDSPLSYINYNGEMFPCPGMYKAKWALGNIRESGFTDIWRTSSVLAHLRAQAGPRITGLADDACHPTV